MRSKKRLSESMEILLTVEPNVHVMVENMMAEWGGTPYSQLSVVLVHLKHLYVLHQNHHWTSMGDPFYGDHLLFQRLYEATVEEIDSIAEKAIGLVSNTNVDLQLVNSQVLKLICGQGSADRKSTRLNSSHT